MLYELTVPSRAGTVASTAPTKNKLMTTLGLLGSSRNMWCISGSLPYLKGFSAAGSATFGSSSMVREKALLL